MPLKLRTVLERELEACGEAMLSGEERETFGYYGLSEEEMQDLQTDSRLALRGKVRDLLLELDHITMVHSDRLSAFDRFIATVPSKGIILAEMTDFWLHSAGVQVPAYDFVRQNVRTIRGQRMAPLKCEIIVRGYLAGNALRAYEKGKREICNQTLPDGIGSYGALPEPIITPTSKAATGKHDHDMSPEELFKNGICTEAEWRILSGIALDLYEHGRSVFAEKGWILADTKYEFGRDSTSHLRVIDEVHTPDSSRIWKKSTYQSRIDSVQVPEMFDKELMRQELMSAGYKGKGKPPAVSTQSLVKLCLAYLEVCESICGKEMEIEEGDLRGMSIDFLK